MTVQELFSRLFPGNNFPKRQITNITCDSRKVTAQSVFVCVKGSCEDGHDYVQEALQKGAQFIVAEQDCGIKNQVIVQDTRLVYSKLCAAYFGFPSKKLNLIGVTGTNGKTTTTWLVHHALKEMGIRAGLVGTICNDTGSEVSRANYTTPDPWSLQQLFADMVDNGCTHVVMEVSSQALDQKRLAECDFSCGVFTNLSPEHMDYHQNMENYYHAKKILFAQCGKAVINQDDAYGRRLAEELTKEGKELFFFGRETSADLYVQNESFFADHCEAELCYHGKHSHAKLLLPGKFSTENLAAAVSILVMCGFDFEKSVKSVCSCQGIPGRCEVCLHKDGVTVIRDYAHTPDSLQKILSSMREFCEGRLIVVYGCPGRRDRTKRPKMTKAVLDYSDFAILTADNPREEPLEDIFADALFEIGNTESLHVIVDRKEAIKTALSQAKSGDIIVLAGKGHENYQVLSDRTIYFDEKEIVQSLGLHNAED